MLNVAHCTWHSSRYGFADCLTTDLWSSFTVLLRLLSSGMPRVYKKKGLKNKWTDKQLNEVTGKVQRKELTLTAAAETYGIP